MIYALTEQQHAQLMTMLAYSHLGAYQLVKGLKPVEPHSWYSALQDESMTDKLRKDHERLGSYTHKHGKYDLPLYALEAK